MNERQMFCSNQQAPYLDNRRHFQYDNHSEPYIAQGNTLIFRRSNTYQVSPETVNRPDLHFLPEQVSRPAFYRTAAHNQPNHPAGNYPSSSVRELPVPLSYGSVHNLPSSSYYNGNVLQNNEHVMSNYSEAGVRDLWTESPMDIPGNLYQLGESARPSTSAAPLTSCHFGPRSASMEAPLRLPAYRGYGNSPTMEREARHRYCVDQSFLPYCTWLNQQPISNAGGLPRNGPRMTPYSQGSNVQGATSEPSISSLPIHPERSVNRGSRNFLHSSTSSVQHPNRHPSQSTPANRPRPLDLSRFRSRTEDDVLILEGYNDESSIDHHVHSDVDNISYEDLLALSERIGTVSNGLTEKLISRQLKTRQYSAAAATINQEPLPCINQDHDSCIICQDEYEVNDKLGISECGHEFHLHCFKKWLLIKNVCPLCKSVALVT